MRAGSYDGTDGRLVHDGGSGCDIIGASNMAPHGIIASFSFSPFAYPLFSMKIVFTF